MNGMSSYGDMARHFSLRSTNVMLRQRLDTLTEELSTGVKNDLPAALKGQQGRLASILARLGTAEAQTTAATELGATLSTTQAALSRIDGARNGIIGQLINVAPGALPDQLAQVGKAAEAAFGDTISALGTRIGGQALFAGTASDGMATASASDIMADLRATIAGSGAVTADDLKTVVSDYFGAAGGYLASGYQGDTGALASRSLGASQPVELSARADDPALRAVLAGAALAAVAADGIPVMTSAQTASLMHGAADQLMTAGQGLIGLSGEIGYSEGRVEEAKARLSAEVTSLTMLRGDLVAADPFETASALNEVQLQLETHYSVTAQLSRLSLTNYL